MRQTPPRRRTAPLNVNPLYVTPAYSPSPKCFLGGNIPLHNRSDPQPVLPQALQRVCAQRLLPASPPLFEVVRAVLLFAQLRRDAGLRKFGLTHQLLQRHPQLRLRREQQRSAQHLELRRDAFRFPRVFFSAIPCSLFLTPFTSAPSARSPPPFGLILLLRQPRHSLLSSPRASSVSSSFSAISGRLPAPDSRSPRRMRCAVHQVFLLFHTFPQGLEQKPDLTEIVLFC